MGHGSTAASAKLFQQCENEKLKIVVNTSDLGV